MYCYILNIKGIGFMVSEDFLQKFFPVLRAIDHQIAPKGLDWQDTALDVAIYSIYMVSDFFFIIDNS